MKWAGKIDFDSRPQYDADGLVTTIEVDTISGSLQTNIDGKSDISHIHDDRYYTSSEVDDLITTISGNLDDHNELNNLDYSSSGHTGFQPSGDYTTTSELTSMSGILQTNIDEKSDTGHLHDDRYYTESETDTISGSLQTNIDGKSDTAHIHDDRYYTESEVDDLITTISGKLDDHNELNNLDYSSSGHTGFQPSGDYVTGSELISVSGSLQTNIDGKSDITHTHDDRYYTESETNTISGSLQTNIDGKADTSHIHDDRYYTETELDAGQLDNRYYTESEVDTISGSLQTNIDGKSDTSHIHDDRYYTESEVDDLITTISGKFDDHNELNNLDYASSGHTGFQPAGDYLTDSEFSTYSGTLQSQIDGKSDVAHLHDDRYYTESEIDTISGSLQTNIDGKSDTSHTHDDLYYTESEVDTISGALNTKINGKADTSHIHDDRYYTESEVDDLITTISGKLDDHNELNNLDYASSGHTGFQPAGNYVTDSELTSVSGALQTNIDGKSDTSHLHDDRYYTETELDNGALDNRYYTESEIDTISGSLQTNIDGKSGTAHIHDDRYYTESEVDTISGTLQTSIDNVVFYQTFLDLTDTPTTYSGQAGKYLKVSSDESELEYVTISGTATTIISSWAHYSGDIYYADFQHNLNTNELAVFIVDSTTNKKVEVEDIEITNANTVRIYINGNTESLKINVVIGGFGTETTITTGISNNDIVIIDSLDVADNEYSKFTTSGIEGRSYSEVLSDLSGQATSAFDWNNQVVSNPEFKDYSETKTAPSSSAGTLILDIENSNVFTVTLSEDVTTLNFNNPSQTGKACNFTLILTQDSTPRTVAWPGTVKWGDGTAPTITTASAIYILTFITVDAGTTWYGFLSGSEMA